MCGEDDFYHYFICCQGDYEVKTEVLESKDGAPIACYIVTASFRSTALDCTNILNKFKAECKDVIGQEMR